MSKTQVFGKVLLTEIFNRAVVIKCETEEEYKKAIKSMVCPAEVIGGEDQYIKPIIDVDAYDNDIDVKFYIDKLKKIMKAVLKEDFPIEYAYREPRMYNGKMKYSYRIYIQNLSMKVLNVMYFLKIIRLDKIMPGVDYSIYKKGGVLHTPYTTKKSSTDENGKKIVIEVPPLIPVNCSIFDCCASYIKEDDCTYWDEYYQEFREADELIEQREYEKKMKEKQDKADDVDSEAAEKKLKLIIEKLKGVRSDDYDSWSKMVWCVIGICEKSDIGMTTCSALVHSFSQKSKKYREREVDKFFHQSYNNQPLKQYGWTYLMKCLKEDDPDYYNELRPTKEEEEPTDELDEHQKWKKEFEKTHCKIVNSSLFIKLVRDEKGYIKEFKTFNKSSLLVSYEDAVYYITETTGKKGKEKTIKKSHINEWLTDPTMRKYEEVDVYPPPLKCPDNILNLWTPFYVEQLPDLTDKDKTKDNIAKRDEILHHIKILCNHDADDYTFMCKWIGQMLKYPATKSFTPCLISEEGAGKGTLMYLFKRMLGKTKVIETADPANYVWGSFNELMATSFLVNCNEMDMKSANSHEGKIKALQTDESLYINPKGKSAFKVTSYHRFFITTNKNNPITTHAKDRRNKIIRSSDEKLQNGVYFKNLLELINNDVIMKLVYDYCITMDGLDTFHTEQLKQNAYQQSLSEGNIPIPERFMKYFTYKNRYCKEPKQYSPTSLLKEFTTFINNNGMKYEADSAKLMRNLQLLKLPLWYEKKRANYGMNTLIDFQVLAKHYEFSTDGEEEEVEDEKVED